MFTRVCYGRRNYAYNYSEFICDSADDIGFLPTNVKKVNGTTCAIGSRAFIPDSSITYILDNKNNWVQIATSSGSGTINVADITATDRDFNNYFDLNGGE